MVTNNDLPAHRQLSDQQLADLKAALSAGRSVRAVAGELGLRYETCLAVAKGHGWFTRRPHSRATDQQTAELVDLVDSGTSVRAAAHTIGISLTVAYRVAMDAGVHVRQPGNGITATARRVEYLRLRLARITRKDAALAVGICRRTALDFDKGVTTSNTKSNKNKHRERFIPAGGHAETYNHLMQMMLERTADPAARNADPQVRTTVDVTRVISDRYISIEERERLADLRRDGKGVREIARTLGRSPATISKELGRNRNPDGSYGPHQAQRKATIRRLRPKPGKLIKNRQLYNYVVDKLKAHNGWSPEQIAGRIQLDYPDDDTMRVSMETVYEAFYLDVKGGLGRLLGVTLPSGRSRRKPQKIVGQRPKRFIDEMTMIDQRPEEVDDRVVPGHWEGDLILGAGNKSAIGTLVERSSLFTTLVHVDGRHDAETVCQGLKTAVQTLDKRLWSSITWDQGSEMALHKTFSMATDVDVYFAYPGRPWERGLNENTNGRIRRDFPKGTDLAVYGPEDLELVANKMNNTPRKSLGYQTPAEVIHHKLENLGT